MERGECMKHYRNGNFYETRVCVHNKPEEDLLQF